MGLHLAQRRHRLRFGDRIMDREVGAQAVAVFHQDVPAKTQPGFFAVGLSIQHAFRIGRTPVRGVATRLAAEVDRRIAEVFLLGRGHFPPGGGAVLAHQALQAGPRFDERAVGGVGLVAGPAFPARQVIDLDKEEPGHVGGEHAWRVLGEDAVMEAAPAPFTVEEPGPEQVGAGPFAEEPFAAHAVAGGEPARLEPLLGRNAGVAFFRVEIVEQRRELLEHGIHVALDGPQRMILRPGGVAVDGGEKFGRGWGSSPPVFQTPIQPSC